MEVNNKLLGYLERALEHEKEAIELYDELSAKCKEDPHIEEMFLQFSKNENWHALAIEEKIKKLSGSD